MKKEYKQKLKDILHAYKRMAEGEMKNTTETDELTQVVKDCEELIIEVDKIK